MAKKRSSRVATKRKTKKKSWWSFFFVLAIATVIGLPIAAKINTPHGQVAGIVIGPTQTPYSWPSKTPTPWQTKPPITITTTPKLTVVPTTGKYATVASLYRKGCNPNYQYIQFTCMGGYQGTYTATSCVSATTLLSKADSICRTK